MVVLVTVGPRSRSVESKQPRCLLSLAVADSDVGSMVPMMLPLPSPRLSLPILMSPDLMTRLEVSRHLGDVRAGLQQTRLASDLPGDVFPCLEQAMELEQPLAVWVQLEVDLWYVAQMLEVDLLADSLAQLVDDLGTVEQPLLVLPQLPDEPGRLVVLAGDLGVVAQALLVLLEGDVVQLLGLLVVFVELEVLAVDPLVFLEEV